ncbi:hypothetical protein [Streptomyces cadmiisoli]|uniref:hypothetical protein n=1 Tax=Streptomyces cadmiisoli TaxID=2184053 RepID=UPI00364AB02E
MIRNKTLSRPGARCTEADFFLLGVPLTPTRSPVISRTVEVETLDAPAGEAAGTSQLSWEVD